MEAVKPDPGSSWEGHSRRVGAGVGDESVECCGVVCPLRISSVIRPDRCTYVVVRCGFLRLLYDDSQRVECLRG